MNLRKLEISHLTNSVDDLYAWMKQASIPVQLVTSISGAGQVYQEPYLNEESYVDPSAQLIGGIVISAGCYIGPYAVIRVDEKDSVEPLIIDEDSNIQDGAIIHSTTQKIGKRVIIAHQAIVHGAIIEDDVTLYIQAVADGNGTKIGKGSFIHQGAYIGKGITLKPHSYVAPGEKILEQNQADRLPPVPESLIVLRNHVLDQNMEHQKHYSRL